MQKNTFLVNGGAMPSNGNDRRAEPNSLSKPHMSKERRSFIGVSDARIIMGDDGDKLTRLWREKRGELEPQDLSKDLIVQLGSSTEDLNRAWYERSSGHTVEDVQRKVRHPIHKWMGAT